MTNFIPIFPLPVIVFPGETLNLHIFEPRYKQLVDICEKERKPFGIPAVVDNRMEEYGTLMEIERIETKYDNGEMDICTRGLKIFRTLEVIRDVPGKLYAGAIVNYPVNHTTGSARLIGKVVQKVRKLHILLKVKKDFQKQNVGMTSYDIAHHVGFSQKEEYEFLCLMHESQRIEFLTRHLDKVIPLMDEMEHLKKRVKLNGHFRNLSAGDF